MGKQNCKTHDPMERTTQTEMYIKHWCEDFGLYLVKDPKISS